jgi:hypothetical protein
MLALLFAGTLVGNASAEENGDWKLFGKTGLGLTQSSFSDNWNGSETGSMAWTWTLLGEAEKQVNPKLLWSNTLNMAFGQTHQHDPAVERWEKPIKSTDKIRFDTVARLTLGGWVDPYAAGFVKTQFYSEMEGMDSEALSPMLVSESVGMARPFVDEERRKLVTRVGFAFHQNRNAFSPDQVWTNDGGIEWVTDWKLASSEDKTVYISKLSVYKTVFYSESDAVKGTPMEDDWKAADVDWENTLTNKLTDSISFDFYFQLVYDKQQSKKGQYKQSMGVGVAYQFL